MNLTSEEEAFILSERTKQKAKTGSKSAKTKKSSKLTDEDRRERIRQGLMRKVECEARALKIIESCLDGAVTDREWLRKAIEKELNAAFYDDLVDERSCAKLCGYSLCEVRVESKQSQQFKISLSAKKVYDITERKKFCSNLCFKSSNFLKSQIPSCPLWMREEESERVQFLDEISNESKSKISGSGDEVVLSKVSIRVDDEANVTGSRDEDEANEAESKCDTEIEDDYRNDDGISVKEEDEENIDPVDLLIENLEEIQPQNSSSNENHEIKSDQTRNQKEVMNSSSDKEPPKIKIASSESKNVKLKKVRKEPEIPPLIKVESFFKEWITQESSSYLLEGFILNQAPSPEEMSLELEEKLQKLSVMVKDSKEELNNVQKKPVPSMKELEESEAQLQSKVSAFFQGKTSFVVEKEEEQKDVSMTGGGIEYRLPPVDKHSQRLLRRRVFLDQLERVLPDISSLCGLQKVELAETTRKLSTTLNLTAQNVILKPSEWVLAGIFFIVAVSMKDKELSPIATSVKTKTTRKNLDMVLMGYGTKIEQVENFVETCLYRFRS